MGLLTTSDVYPYIETTRQKVRKTSIVLLFSNLYSEQGSRAPFEQFVDHLRVAHQNVKIAVWREA